MKRRSSDERRTRGVFSRFGQGTNESANVGLSCCERSIELASDDDCSGLIELTGVNKIDRSR